jgi:hypothetical protein
MRRVLGLFSGGRCRAGAPLRPQRGAGPLRRLFRVPPIPGRPPDHQLGLLLHPGVFSLFVSSTRCGSRARGGEVWRGWIRRPGAAGARDRRGTLFAVWSDSFKHKILYDEFVIQGTAYEMHATKQVSTILRAYNIFGHVAADRLLPGQAAVLLPVPGVAPARPHGLPDREHVRAQRGVRRGAPRAPLLVRPRAGRGARRSFAVALMATHAALRPERDRRRDGPAQPDHDRARGLPRRPLPAGPLGRPALALRARAVLLTQSRYESILFVGAGRPSSSPSGWMRAGRAVLPWPAVMAPLLLVPYAWHSRVLASEPVFWQLEEGQTSAFGPPTSLSNLRGDATFLFNTGHRARELGVPDRARLLPAWPGSSGWRRVPVARCRGRAPRSRPRSWSAPPSARGRVHFGVLLFYWWAKFNDLMASRFALPMCLAFAVLAAVLVRGLSRPRLPALRIAWAASGSGSSRWGCRRSR